MLDRAHILVVEDDPLVSEVVMDALGGLYRTSRAETAAAALECLRRGGIDAMLLDCTLPGGLHPQLVPTADEAKVPIVLMSGHPDMIDRVPGSGRPYILKPFSLTSLLMTVRGAIGTGVGGTAR